MSIRPVEHPQRLTFRIHDLAVTEPANEVLEGRLAVGSDPVTELLFGPGYDLWPEVTLHKGVVGVLVEVAGLRLLSL